MQLLQHRGTRLEEALRAPDLSIVEQYRAAGHWRDRTSLDDFLTCVARHPDKAAIVSYRRGSSLPTTLTYGQLGARVEQFAARLLALGIERGDIVTIQLPNGWEGPALALAVMRVGAVPNPVPIIYRERELRFMLAHAESRVYFVPCEFRGYQYGEMGIRLRTEISSLEHVFVLDAPGGWAQDTDFDKNFLRDAPVIDDDVRVALEERRPGSDDIAMLVYTSGTTGNPKAVLHSHNTAWSGHHRVHAFALEITPDDVMFMASTIGHLTGFVDGMLVPLALGQKIVYQDIWDARQMLEILEIEGITWTLSATTFALDMIAEARGRLRSSSTLRAFACGGAAITPGLAQSMEELFGTSMVPLWGCTEAGIATIHRPGTATDILDASDGHVVPWQEVRVVDAELDPVPAGSTGSLQVRGPSVFVGYFKQADLTEAAFSKDGWLDTGDLGRDTGQGIRIEGRTKDIIVRGGQNISALEIENALYSHPSVQEVAVVSYPDDRLGERVCAVVQAPGRGFCFDEMVSHLGRVGMAKPFWPEKLIVLDELPHTPSGKIQKFVLRERLLAGALTEASSAQTSPWTR